MASKLSRTSNSDIIYEQSIVYKKYQEGVDLLFSNKR